MLPRYHAHKAALATICALALLLVPFGVARALSSDAGRVQPGTTTQRPTLPGTQLQPATGSAGLQGGSRRVQ